MKKYQLALTTLGKNFSAGTTYDIRVDGLQVKSSGMNWFIDLDGNIKLIFS